MNKLLLPSGLWPEGLVLIRIITGIFLIYHGTQMFNTEDMNGYAKWLADLGAPFPDYAGYVGKSIELSGGTCLILGLFTRIACIFLIGTFLFISLFMGHGKIFNDSQHSFLFAMLSTVFLFMGPGKRSLDHRFFGGK